MSSSAKRTAAEQREFLDQVDAQNTAAVRARAYKYARAPVALLLARCGVAIERILAKHLVADSLGDTYMGDVSWEPSRCDLYLHLRSVIRHRTKDMLARSRRLPHARFGGSFDDEVGDRVEAEASGQASQVGDAARSETVDLATQIAGRLYSAASTANDDVMTRVLDAYAAGFTGRAEVADHIGISRKQYDYVRDRIKTLLKRLPEQLAADAEETLGRTR